VAKKKRPPGPRRPSPRLLAQLDAAEALLADGQWEEAERLLEELDRRHPRQPDVLALRLAVAAQLGDLRTHQLVCEQLIELLPDDLDLPVMLAGSYLTNGRIALGLRAMRDVLARWPDHAEADRLRGMLADLEPGFHETLAAIGLGGPDDLRLAERHERSQLHLERGEYASARAAAEEVLRERPAFAAGLNNVAEAYGREGDYDRAVATVRRVFDFAPGNVFARAVLTRFLFLAGRRAEAAEEAGRLKALTPARHDEWLKVAEALSFLGDDAGVLAAYAGSQKMRPKPHGGTGAFLEHLAGVAAYRQGRESEARKHWRRALKHQPGFDWARLNLDDLKKPLSERHAAWPFDLPAWLPRRVLDRLAWQIGAGGRSKRNRDVKAGVRRFLDEHPAVAAQVPALLDRGDEKGRTWALELALLADVPPLWEALKTFALGQRGPDAQRIKAAQMAADAEVIPAGPTRLWVEGEWRELTLTSFEITEEPSYVHSAEVTDLAAEAHAALQDGDGIKAERLLKQALEREPDAPDLLNNLAAAYGLQDRTDESDELVRQVHARFPDYWFGVLGVARQTAAAGDTDAALKQLLPLLARKKLHVSEFVALAMAYVDLLLARGEYDGAEAWLKMWEDVTPDHPALPDWQRRVQDGSLLGLLGKIMNRGRKRKRGD
jgi:tetratricopeptide (TPR) repeat protein